MNIRKYITGNTREPIKIGNLTTNVRFVLNLYTNLFEEIDVACTSGWRIVNEQERNLIISNLDLLWKISDKKTRFTKPSWTFEE